MFSIVREHCANNSFLASFTPLAEHFLLYMTTMNLSIFHRVSELTSTGCRDRSRKAYVTGGQELHANHANHADFFPRPRKLDTVSHPLTAGKNINAFSLHIFHVDSNLSKVNTDSKANPEFVKPKRQEIPIARTTHLVRIITLRSPCRARCATWSRMRVSGSSWEHGWRYSTSLVSLCVETIASSSVLMITFLPPVSQDCICNRTDSEIVHLC